MTDETFDLEEPELTSGDLLFVFSFSRYGKHLDGSDLLWNGGYTTTYE